MVESCRLVLIKVYYRYAFIHKNCGEQQWKLKINFGKIIYNFRWSASLSFCKVFWRCLPLVWAKRYDYFLRLPSDTQLKLKSKDDRVNLTIYIFSLFLFFLYFWNVKSKCEWNKQKLKLNSKKVVTIFPFVRRSKKCMILL